MTDLCHTFTVETNTIYGLISFDFELEAADYASRHNTTYEVHWA